MKAIDAVKIGGILFAGVAAYLVVTRTMKAGGDVVAAAKKVVTEDLNPASTENVVYKAASAVTDTFAADGEKKPLGVRIWETLNPEKVQLEKDMLSGTSDVSNVKKQASAYSQGGPSTGIFAVPSANQTPAEEARLRRYQAIATSGTNAKNLFDMHYNGDTYGLMQ